MNLKERLVKIATKDIDRKEGHTLSIHDYINMCEEIAYYWDACYEVALCDKAREV